MNSLKNILNNHINKSTPNKNNRSSPTEIL
jgi:hypothetical protein